MTTTARIFLMSGFVFLFVFLYWWYLTPSQKDYVAISRDATTADILFEKIKKLPLEKRIGQLMIFGFTTKTPNDHIRQLIAHYGIGGVNLLKRNVENAEQVKHLTASLQELTIQAEIPPLFIAVDQEGGAVVRFPFLSELTVEKDIKSEREAFRIAKERGTELTNLGITMNFAPVLDYVPDKNAYLYDRTFATTTQITAHLGVAMARGYQAAGIIPVFKHFPGYGVITVDPHQKDVYESILSAVESMEPFRLALGQFPIIPLMTAHIIYQDIDTVPATRSSKFLTNILRNEWGYTGVIITDDIEMASAGGVNPLSVGEIAVQALEAGADMIISTYTEALHGPIIKAVEKAIVSGRLSEERLNRSVLRVWRLKLDI